MSEHTHTFDGETCYLSGAVDFATAPAILKAVSNRLESGQSAVVDFSQVTHANSVALALMLEWKTVAAEHGCSVTHQNLPDSIRQLSEISQVSTLI